MQRHKSRHDTVLTIHSNTGYLNEENTRSRAGGHHFLSEDVPNPPNNSGIHNKTSIIKSVMSSADKAKMGALSTSAHKGVEERNIPDEMEHKQPPTPVQTDNLTAEGIINS
eukprot:CCRYP_009144-RA/>CCRYP_009144-RA protein AED:0.45 eAED:0.45 QI:0/0/0/1/0/0/2/0/110